MDSTTRSRSFYVVNPKSKSRLFALMEFEESYTPEENSLEIIVLCHGLGGSTNSRVVSGIASHLKCQNFLSGRKRAIVRFDFEANGQSDGTWDFASYFAQVEDLRAVVESLRTQGHIVSAIAGHSMGGNVKFNSSDRNFCFALKVFIFSSNAGSNALQCDLWRYWNCGKCERKVYHDRWDL